MTTLPRYDFDLFCDAGITQPYAHYAAIRALGPVVELPACEGVLAVGRYADVKPLLRDNAQFVSGQGVTLNALANQVGAGTTIMSDPPLHQTLRSIIGAPLTPAAVAELREQFQRAADELIERLVARRTFDGMADLARFLPVSIVSNLVGLPEQGRANMLEWAAATFDSCGPPNDRTQKALPKAMEMVAYVVEQAGPEQVKPGSWAARIYAAVERGLVTPQQAPMLLIDYLGPSLDTTIFATGHALRLLSQHPEQWQMLRANPEAHIANTIEEVVRLESPIRSFTRVAQEDCVIDGTPVAAGSRLLVMYASANRDERKWTDPERFDITRAGLRDQLGFGFGRHVCAGQHLARLEISCLLRALAARVPRFTTGEPVVQMNNILRGYASLPVQVH